MIHFEFLHIAGIEDLCAKRDVLHKNILEEEEEKKKVQNDIRILTERLAKINESLSKKMASRNDFDKTIAETEGAYMKVRNDKVVFTCMGYCLHARHDGVSGHDWEKGND